MMWEKSPAHWEQDCLEKCSFSQAGREAHDFIERELRQTLLAPLAKSPHNSGVKVHILPFPPLTLISQQSEMTFLLSIEGLIEPSTGPKELIKAIFHLGEKSMQSTEVQLSRAASLCSRVLFQSSCLFAASPHQFSLCCFLSALHASFDVCGLPCTCCFNDPFLWSVSVSVNVMCYGRVTEVHAWHEGWQLKCTNVVLALRRYILKKYYMCVGCLSFLPSVNQQYFLAGSNYSWLSLLS